MGFPYNVRIYGIGEPCSARFLRYELTRQRGKLWKDEVAFGTAKWQRRWYSIIIVRERLTTCGDELLGEAVLRAAKW